MPDLQLLDAGASFRAGVAQGRTRNALQTYQDDPGGAVNALMPINPALATQLQDRNVQAKDRILHGEQQDAAAQEQARTQGTRVITGVLGSVRRTIQDPEQRRQAILHVLQQLGPQLPAGSAERLTAMAQNLDTSDAGLDSVLGALQGPPTYHTQNMGRAVGVFDNQGGAPQIFTPPELPPTPLEQARIAEIQSRIPLHQAQAERASRPPAGNSGHGRSGGGGRRRRSRGGGGGGVRDGGSGATPAW